MSPVPEVVLRLAAGRSIVPGLAQRDRWGDLCHRRRRRVRQGWVRRTASSSPADEAQRLAWLGSVRPGAGRTRLRCRARWHGVAAHLSGLAGTSAVLGEWLMQSGQSVVPELGRALRSVPRPWCRWRRARGPGQRPSGWPPRGSRAARARRRVPTEDLVVCHGDACNPNFILDANGASLGYVDLGLTGVADRWADLAPALLSLGWNYGPGWEPAFLDGYGIDLDAGQAVVLHPALGGRVVAPAWVQLDQRAVGQRLGTAQGQLLAQFGQRRVVVGPGGSPRLGWRRPPHRAHAGRRPSRRSCAGDGAARCGRSRGRRSPPTAPGRPGCHSVRPARTPPAGRCR